MFVGIGNRGRFIMKEFIVEENLQKYIYTWKRIKITIILVHY